MEELTFGTCIKNSWISTWQAIVQMPGFFLCVFAVLTCTTLLSGPFQHLSSQDVALDAAAKVGQSFVKMGCSILQLVVYGCVMIKVNRFLLLGEGSQPLFPLGGKPLGRYLLFSMGLALAMVVVTVLMTLILVPVMRSMRVAGFVLFVILIAIAYLYAIFRLCLIYPAVSLGSPLALRAAWKDSRGHFWSILGVGIVAHLPLTLVWIVALVALGPRLLMSSAQGSVAFSVGFGLVNTIFIGLAASVLSWLYRRYANELLEHVAR